MSARAWGEGSDDWIMGWPRSGPHATRAVQTCLAHIHTSINTHGHTVLCPPMVDRLLAQAGFRVAQRSQVPAGFKELADADGPARGNLYEGRDYLVVCEAV